MMKGLSLTALAKKIEANSAAKADFVVDTRQLSMSIRTVGESNAAEFNANPGARLPVLGIPNQGEFPLQPLAHDQLGARIKIPSVYYDRMLKDAPDLLATNVNTWFSKIPEKRMIRTLHREARAFLSNRYQRIDNNEVAEVALPVLMDLPGVQIVSSEVTDRRLYIHFVVPTIQGEVKRGDVVQAGGVLSNSEVGLGSLAVAELNWRLLCLNGMKGQELLRKYHTGRHIEETGEIDWADDTRAADDRAVLLKVRDMVKAVVDSTRFRVTLDKLKGLTEGKITGDPAKAVEVLAQKVGCNESEQGGILRALIEGGDLSRWGIVNAVTAQAHNAANYDRAVELEAAGGKLVDLPKTEWKELLEAA
jgi:hypothetical protein